LIHTVLLILLWN